MAVYNEILVGRYNRFLQKILGLKGGPPAAALAGEIMPVLQFEEFGVENRYLTQWNRFASFGNAAAVVGQNGGAKWRNPAGSNVVVVVEKIAAWGDVASKLTLSRAPSATDLTNVFTGIQLDTRIAQLNSTLVVSGFSNVVDLGFPIQVSGHAVNLPQDLILTVNQELPVLPGDSYLLRWGALNVNINCSLIWRERFLEESERA